MSEYLLLITPKHPRFTTAQLQTLVDILVNAGSISVGSILIPALFNNFSTLNLIIGICGGIIFWLVAVRTAKYINNG